MTGYVNRGNDNSMKQFQMPDNLVNSLIKRKGGEEVRRVIRDDGENGLHISDPEAPANMYPIARDEFRNDWELYATVEEQLQEVKVLPEKERPFRNEPEEYRVEGVNLSSQMRLPSVDSRTGVDMTDDRSQLFGNLGRDPFFGRTTDTAKPDADALTSANPADATLTGHPVGGNEEPAETFETDRADDDGMALGDTKTSKGK